MIITVIQRVTKISVRSIVVIIGCFTATSCWAVPSIEQMWQVIQQQQKTIATLQKQLAIDKGRDHAPQQPAATGTGDSEERTAGNEGRSATMNLAHEPERTASGWWNRIDVGGYGSTRFEAGSLDRQHAGFTFRRFVLDLDAQPWQRLQISFELEFERFARLELEKGIHTANGGLEVSQAIEGGNDSEITLEEAWARYRLIPALQVDVGALLVPLGRFNIEHDDNEWVLPRRSLIDRGTPVLPVAAAWTEAGAGISGALAIGGARVDYRLYALNGMAIDFGIEQELEIAAGTGAGTELESVTEAEFGPAPGSFAGNTNGSLAFAGRFNLHPAPGQEVALSGYMGNYVPAFLGRDETVWSVGIDGLHHFGGFEVEYEALTTHYDGLQGVAGAFAERVVSRQREINGVPAGGAFATHKIEFGLSQNVMARNKTGYWIEIRRPLHVELFHDTLFGHDFPDQMLIPVLRMEQVFFDDQLQGIEFDGATLTAYKTRNASVNRATLGLGYRPVPGWMVQLAGEYTWTGADSLAGLTNYLPAGGSEKDNFSLLLGAAFGF